MYGRGEKWEPVLLSLYGRAESRQNVRARASVQCALHAVPSSAPLMAAARSTKFLRPHERPGARHIAIISIAGSPALSASRSPMPKCPLDAQMTASETSELRGFYHPASRETAQPPSQTFTPTHSCLDGWMSTLSSLHHIKYSAIAILIACAVCFSLLSVARFLPRLFILYQQMERMCSSVIGFLYL